MPTLTAHRRADRSAPLRRWAVACVLASAACGPSAGSGDARALSDALPRLEEVPVPVPEHSPTSPFSSIVAGAEGGWLYAAVQQRGSALVAVDSSGRVATPLGGLGEGPGEMRSPFPLWLDDTVAIGHDLATRRIIVWGRDGKVRREFRAAEPVVPFARGPGLTLLASRFRGDTEVPVLVDLASGEVHDVVPPADSMLALLFRDDATISDRVANSPAIGRWHDGVVVANGLTYDLGLWRSDGSFEGILSRELPPTFMGAEAVERELRSLGRSPAARGPGQLERLRRELETTPVRRFTHVGPPRSDGRGRLWVVVKEGDTVAADVFTTGRFLGRLPLECPGYGDRWDLNGEWLLLVCEPDDPEVMLDAVVRRYRIVEP